MRRLLIFIALLVLAFGGAGFWGESILAKGLHKAQQTQPDLRIGAVTPLRRFPHFGVRMTDLRIDRLGLGVAAAELGLAIAILRPGHLRLDLPDRIMIDTPDQPVELGLSHPLAELDVTLLQAGAVQRLQLADYPIRLNGRTVIDALDLKLTAADDAPLADVAPYDLDLQILGVKVPLIFAAVAPMIDLPAATPHQIDLSGQAQIWLDHRLDGISLSGRKNSPELRGLILRDVRIAATDPGGPMLSASGQVVADENGQADGIIAIYTRDAETMFDLAVSAGLLGKPAAKLALGALKSAAQIPTPKEVATEALRDPAPDELRLLIQFAQGQTRLAGVPIGPAPVLAR